MKHTKRTSCLSILLVFAMVATCFVAFSVTSSAELATDLPTSWGAELPEGAVAWGQKVGDVDMTKASTSLSGSGTKADPYLIANVADFMFFMTSEAAKATGATEATEETEAKEATQFKLTGDIYFPVIKDTATKSRYFVAPTFAGHFDGNGHTIWNPRNTYTTNESKYPASLFGTLDGATVENLTIKGAFFSNTYSSTNDNNHDGAHAAGLADVLKNGGTVTNCHVVDAFLSGTNVGGLVQNANDTSKISGCTASGTFAPDGVTENACFGGIVGNAGDGSTVTIENCVNRMSCESDSNYIRVGGIMGYVKRSKAETQVTFRNCQNYGSYINNTEAAAVSKGIGGILGHAATAVGVVMENCQNYGDFTAPNYCGGMIGFANATGSARNISLTKCANYGNITATGQSAGGMIGQTTKLAGNTLAAQDCANYGNIQAKNCAGGYIGTVENGENKSTMANCVNYANYGDVTATNKYAGLIAGLFIRGTSGTKDAPNVVVTNSVLTGSVSAGACAGSICGGYTSGKTGCNMFVNTTNVYVDCTIKATERGGAIAGAWLSTDTEVAGTFYDTTGLTLKTTDSKFHVTLNGATPAYDYFVTTTTTADDGVTKTTKTEGKSASLTSLDTAELTNGTALAALNTYASANTLTAWVQGTNAPELEIFYQAPTAVQVTIDGATLSLDDTMTLKLFVKASSVSEIKDNLSSIMVNDGTKDGNYKGTHDAKTGNYVFEITNLAAGDMGTAKTYTVKYTLKDTANPIVCDTGVTYSPLQYAINMYKKNNGADKEFAALLTSMVRYMDAAGATGAKSTFATATGYTIDDTTVNTDYAAIMKKATEYTIPADTMSLAAELTSGITLLVKPADGKTLTSVKIGTDTDALTLESVGDNIWRVNGLNPGDLYNELTFTFTTTGGTTEVTTEVTYSVARYLNNYVGTEYETLAKATVLYMDAFITYKTATN